MPQCQNHKYPRVELIDNIAKRVLSTQTDRLEEF